MDLVFISDARFVKNSEGRIYSLNGEYTLKLWPRYLTVFERIYVMARVGFCEQVELSDEYISNGERIEFIELPYYFGPFEYLKKCKELKKAICENLRPDVAYICRVPGQIGNLVVPELKKQKLTYGVEVVGDPWDVFAPGGVGHFLRPFLRYYQTMKLKISVAGCVGALYVTKEKLQRRYPVKRGVFSVSASDVILKADAIAFQPKTMVSKKEFCLLSIGSLEQLYKSPDILLRAFKKVIDAGYSCHLKWLGDGKYRSGMEALADELGISSKVNFEGNVPAWRVNEELKKADLFILASKTEGLPRAMVEAMAAGLPCIGTRVGGIPELLSDQALVEAGDAEALYQKMVQFFQTPSLMETEARMNWIKSQDYREDILAKRRAEFYRQLCKSVRS